MPDAEPQDWDIDEGPQDVAGWSTGAQANTAAAIRWTAWGLLVLGPLLGAFAYLSAPAQAGPAQKKPAPTAPAATGAQGAAGFAQLFVAAFISAGEGDQDKLAAYYPDATSQRREGDSDRRRGEQLTAVRLRQTDEGCLRRRASSAAPGRGARCRIRPASSRIGSVVWPPAGCRYGQSRVPARHAGRGRGGNWDLEVPHGPVGRGLRFGLVVRLVSVGRQS